MLYAIISIGTQLEEEMGHHISIVFGPTKFHVAITRIERSMFGRYYKYMISKYYVI